ncbi:Imm8 family immunity protein, partial [Pseudomonadota bacterium]
IVSYDCTDHDPIDKWVPDDAHDVDFWMNITVGPDSEGGDNFQVHIVTPNNLNGKNSSKHAIVLNEYSWLGVVSEVEKILEQCQGHDWVSISEQLSKHMSWEFENYKPYSGGP